MPFEHAAEFLRNRKKIFITVVVLIVLGLATTLGTTALEKYLHGTEESATQLAWYWATLLKILDHVALGFFSVAILGFVVELRHMHEYFQKLIEQTIVKKEFIKDLVPAEQERMQKQSLEAYFGIDELGEGGDFYDFYVNKIRSQIGGPFRRATTFETVVAPADDSTWRVTDTISYGCMKRGKSIQPEVLWTAEQDEIKKVTDFSITATKPDNTFHTYIPGQSALLKRYEGRDKRTGGHGYTLSLTEYAACDGLRIRVDVGYLVSRDRPFSWSMPYLSDGFSGDIHFPAEFDIFVDLFGLDENALPKNLKTDERGFNVYSIRQKGWLLPDDGFGYYFRPKPPAPPPATTSSPKPAAESAPAAQSTPAAGSVPAGELAPAGGSAPAGESAPGK